MIVGIYSSIIENLRGESNGPWRGQVRTVRRHLTPTDAVAGAHQHS
jgi:hypothetical protein